MLHIIFFISLHFFTFYSTVFNIFFLVIKLNTVENEDLVSAYQDIFSTQKDWNISKDMVKIC